MTKIIKLFLMLGIMAFSGIAAAIPISGTIGFSGDNTIVSGNNYSDVTELSFSNVVVGANATGDFADFTNTGDSATFQNLIIDPFDPQLLWSVGGFNFNATTLIVNFQNTATITMSGIGIISGNDFDATIGTWNLTANSLTFSASSVPAPGIALLLGIGLVGIGLTKKIYKI